MITGKVYFGAPAAERDIDHGLKEYFVESTTYNRFIEKKKYVLIGNRGTGKSAIFKMLAEHEKSSGNIVLELNPENYSYEMLASILAKESEGSWAKQGAFAAAWKYLIYVLIMKKINSNLKGIKTGAANKIYSYLRDNHKEEQPNPIAILISYLKRLEGFKIGSYEASTKTMELARLYKLEEIINLLPSLYELCQKRHVVVLVDELDKGWDASEDAKAFVSGLFQAAMSINDDAKNIKVFISLRKELYDSIPNLYEDAQKYRDIIEYLEWDEELLLNLVAKRIRYSKKELQSFRDKETWESIFSETLDYRQAKSFNYIVDRTLYRPREIIEFCSEIIESQNDTISYPINYDVIIKSELEYSKSRTTDIAAEYRFQWPGLLSIFESFRGGMYSFDRNELELKCLSISTKEIVVDKNANWILDQDPEFIIVVLWKIGFIKALATGGIKSMTRSGSKYIGSYQFPDINLRNINRFQIHPMFRTYLSLKESKDKG